MIITLLNERRGTKIMNYEIVYLNEKIVAGIVARTSNSAENMKKVIGDCGPE